MSPPAVFVKHHQIVEVREFAVDPFLSVLSLFEGFDGVLHNDEVGVAVAQLFGEAAEQDLLVEGNELRSSVVHEDLH